MFWAALWLGSACGFQAGTQDEAGPVQEHVFGLLVPGNLFSIGFVTASLCSRLGWDSLVIVYTALVFTLVSLPFHPGAVVLNCSYPVGLSCPEPTLHLWLPWPQASWDDLKPPGVLQIWNTFPGTLRIPFCLTFLGYYFISLCVCCGYFGNSVIFTVCFPE